MKDYLQQQQEQLVSLDPEERFYGIMGRFQTRLVAAIEEFQKAVGIEHPASWMDDNRALAILEVSQPDRGYVTYSTPATPWQFFKQEYFPTFWLRWFPVRCIEQRVSIKPWEPLAEETLVQWRAYVAEQITRERTKRCLDPIFVVPMEHTGGPTKCSFCSKPATGFVENGTVLACEACQNVYRKEQG